MDGLGLAAIITSGTLGLAGIGAGVWSTVQTGRIARQGRVDERRVDACVEILRFVEHRTLWFERRTLSIARDPWEDSPPMPSTPEISGRIVIETLLVAFGSTSLRNACRGWVKAAEDMDSALEVAAFNWRESASQPDSPTSVADVEMLKSQLERVRRHRDAVEDAISSEVESIRRGVGQPKDSTAID